MTSGAKLKLSTIYLWEFKIGSWEVGQGSGSGALGMHGP